jgi:GNAT superfamily N-acetyltransferase
MPEISYRAATLDDIGVLARMRWEMERERHSDEVHVEEDAYLAAHRRMLAEAMGRGDCMAWLAEADGAPVACTVLLLLAMPPNAKRLERRRGIVTNVYTYPEYRRQGIARHLMQMLIAEAKDRGVHRLMLWASDMGRPLYEDLGFEPSYALEMNL